MMVIIIITQSKPVCFPTPTTLCVARFMTLGTSKEKKATKAKSFLRVCLSRAGKGKEEARRRETGAKNVAVCKFGAGGGERAIGSRGKRQKKRAQVISSSWSACRLNYC